MEVTDEIKPTRRFSREDGDSIIRCQHCNRVMAVQDNDEDGTPRGEDYQDRVCGGWTGVSFDAHFVKTL